LKINLDFGVDAEVLDAASVRDPPSPGGHISVPVILKRVKPSYSEAGILAGIERAVVLEK